MNSTSHSVNEWSSGAWFEAQAMEGVRYEIARVSFARRIELAKKIREIGRRMEFLEASTEARDKLESAVLAAEIDRTYLEWGLRKVEGLEIDGEAATPESLIEKGPVELAAEILGSIKAECGLSEHDRHETEIANGSQKPRKMC